MSLQTRLAALIAAIKGDFNALDDRVTVVEAGGHSEVFGDGSATSFNIDHNLGTRKVIVEVYQNATPWETRICDVARPTTNRVTLTFASAPAVDEFEVVIMTRDNS